MSDGQFMELTLILQDVFDDPSLDIERNTTVNDVPGWDSFSHTVLLMIINQRFSIRLSDATGFTNVGELSDKISKLMRKGNTVALAPVA